MMAASYAIKDVRRDLECDPKSVDEFMAGPLGRDNGFDFIRLLAASAVILSHSFMISFGSNEKEPIYWLSSGQTTIGGVAVGVFFIVSGLFISSSFENSKSIIEFILKRAKRIIPALAVVVIISVMFIGPIYTKFTIKEYFSDKYTWLYLLNAIFAPNFHYLPGVFWDRYNPAINGSLWTLKFEVICYALAGMILMKKEMAKFLTWSAWILSFIFYRSMQNGTELSGIWYYTATTSMLFRFFGAGMLIYLYREIIRLDLRIALILITVWSFSIVTPFFSEFCALLLPYAVITFGYTCPKWMKALTRHGDFSYGVYIYGWPAQQILAPIGLGLSIHWLINTTLATSLAFALGAASWFMIEKPSLRMKLPAS